MKQIYIIQFLLLFVFTSALAQQDFRRGFIVQNQDTLRGFVDYRGDRRSALVTTFKKTMDGPEQGYTPDAISGYGFYAEEKIFESKVVPSSGLPTQVFLHALVKGKASLYYYLDSSQKGHFYLSMHDGALVELIQQEYIQKDSTSGKTYKVVAKIFAGTLGNAFSDCPKFSDSQFQRLSLTDNALTAITRQYNKCQSPESISHAPETKGATIVVGPVVAFSGSSLRFSGDNYLSRASFTNQTTSVGGGISLNASLPRLNEKLSFQLDLLYIPSKYSALHEETDYNSVNIYDVTFNLAYLKLPVQLRYTYPRGSLRPFFNAGALVGYAIRDENQVIKTSTFGGGSTTHSHIYPAIPGNEMTDGFRHFMQGITAGAGLTYPFYNGNLSLEARYEINNGMSYLTGLSSTVNTLYLMLGYSL